ncbi:MAG: hypothetical protein AAGF55_00980 [Pseudomonadota bacterium]
MDRAGLEYRFGVKIDATQKDLIEAAARTRKRSAAYVRDPKVHRNLDLLDRQANLKNLHGAKRCAALTRAGKPCGQAAMRKSKYCVMHGGRLEAAKNGHPWAHRWADKLQEANTRIKLVQDIRECPPEDQRRALEALEDGAPLDLIFLLCTASRAQRETGSPTQWTTALKRADETGWRRKK